MSKKNIIDNVYYRTGFDRGKSEGILAERKRILELIEKNKYDDCSYMKKICCGCMMQELKQALLEENYKDAATATVEAFKKSNFAVKNLSNVIDMFEVIDNINKKEIKSEDLKKEISNNWIQTKKDKNLKTEKEIDRILVDSATKILKEGGKK